MEPRKFELDDRDLNVSIYGDEDEFVGNVNKFIDGYLTILNRSGNTLNYSTNNIFHLIKGNRLWGEGLHLFIDIIEKRGQSLPAGKILKDIFLTNLHNEDDEFITYSANKGLKILEGLNITGQDYLAYKLLQMGQAKVVYNSLIKFLLAYKDWKKKEEVRHYLKNEDIEDYHDEDLYYWLDVADGEATSDIPPSERKLYELDLWDLDEYKPIYENRTSVMNILTKYIDLILETNSTSFRMKMALTDLYSKSIFSKSLNSNLIYGQLQLLLNQIKSSFSIRNINLNYIKETINNFYKPDEVGIFEICRIDFNKSGTKTYVIFAKYEGGFFKSVYLKQLDEYNFLFGVVQQFETENIQRFIDMLLEDILIKHSISDIQANPDEEKNQAEKNNTASEAQVTSDNLQTEVNLDPFIEIDENDLPWT